MLPVSIALISNRSPAAVSLLKMAQRYADMANQQQSRSERNESGIAPSTATTRSSTLSSFSIGEKASTSVPYVMGRLFVDFIRIAHRKPPDPSDYRRSLRQSVVQSAKAPLSLPAAAEPDKLYVLSGLSSSLF